MHWADIVAALRKRGVALSDIARQEGVSPTLVTGVVRGTDTSHKVAYAIAAAAGIPTERMWPGRYLALPDYRSARRGHATGRLPNIPHP